jgi:hypothetical protein
MRRLALASLLAALALVPELGSAQVATNPAVSWAIQHQPAAAAAATISRAAVAGVRHVATSVTVCLTATAAQTGLAFNLRDGATGAGTILWTVKLSGAASTNACVALPVHIAGSPNTAMTLESASAPAATNFATVALTGYEVAFQ